MASWFGPDTNILTSKMKPQARALVLGILTRIREREGTANKTKLLKLLYLADIEHYRATGQTITGFDWIFYFYGPWAPEYDSLLKQLQEENAIKLQAWASAGIEGERISLNEEAQLDKLIPTADAFLRTRRFIDVWADKGVSSLLDYVYFETEPMRDARKMERLDFSKVSVEPPPPYRRTKSGTGIKELRSLRGKFQEVTKKMLSEPARVRHEQAPYDAAYLKALEVLDEQES